MTNSSLPDCKIISRIIRERRSVRKFSNSPVDLKVLEQVFEDVRFMPCPTNRQCFRFIGVEDPLMIQAMRQEIITEVETIAQGLDPEEADIFRKYSHFFTFFEQAPVVIAAFYRVFASRLPTGNENKDSIHGIAEIQAFGGAVAAVLLSLKARNLDSCWMSGPLIAGSKILRLLDVEPPWRLGAFIPVGNKLEPLEPPKKPALKKIFSFIPTR